MAYGKKNLMSHDKDELIQVIAELQLKLKKKNEHLNKTRADLTIARSKVLKMKETVKFQRLRILELHNETS